MSLSGRINQGTFVVNIKKNKDRRYGRSNEYYAENW